MLVNFLVGILGVLIFLFIFWKRLNEDYSSDIIFQVATAILIGLGLGSAASVLFFPAWFFWTSALGALLGMFLMTLKFKLKFYETFEALILAGMPLISLMFFKDAVNNSSMYSFLAFVGTLILIFLSYWFDINYRNFTLYRSGKIGFAGLSTAILLFFARTVIAIAGLTMVSFVGKIEIPVSGAMTLIFIGLLVNLGRKKE
jgi:hypothetical protein